MLLGILLMGLCGLGEWQINTDAFEEIPSYVRSPAVGPDGHVYFNDPREGRVYHLDETGKLVTVFGSKGEGPGEFGSLYQLFVSHSENLVYIRDFSRPKMMVFTPAGKFLRSEIEVESRTFPLLLQGGKTVFLLTEDPFVSKNKGARLMVNQGDGTSHLLASFDAIQHEDLKTVSKDGARGQIYFPWLRRVLWCVTPDQKTVFAGPNEKLNVVVYDAGTLKPVGKIEDNRLVNLPLTEEEIEGTRGGVILNGKEYGGKDFDQPDFKPAILNLMADAVDRLWVLLQRPYGAEKQKYRVYEKNGRFAGALDLPKDFRIFHADKDFIWFTSTNEAGDIMISKKAYHLATP